MRLAVALVVLACLLAPLGHAAAQDEPALVLVVDGAAGRLSVTRLRRALASVLSRPVVRPTDPGAENAAGIMTMAFTAPRSWTVRIDQGDCHSTRTVEVRGPALEVLVGLAVDLIRTAEEDTSAPAVSSGGATTSDPAARSRDGRGIALAHPWDGPINIASEILDPFAGMPVSRVSIAAVSELLDPFAAVGSAIRVTSSPEVLDPWR